MRFSKLLYIALLVFAGSLVGGSSFAQEGQEIEYPVAELGNCVNEQACRTYCDDLQNVKECVAFAQAHNLLSDRELERAQHFADRGVQSGPGGCTSEAACEAHCEDVSRIDECLAFAEEHNILEGEELAEARRVAAVLRQGAQLPGGCTSKASCEAYCEDASHMRECLAFAEAAGFMSAEELEEARKVERALAAGAQLPGGCRGKAECEAYCEAPEHIQECLDFAEAAGFIDPEELETARKVAPLMARGEMPGGCRSRQQCEAYCAEESNIEECAVFFEKAGFISPEEAAMFRKTGGKGPGGCTGRDECEAFCNNPANEQACFEFAKEHDLIPEEELRNLEEGIARFREGIESAPPEVARCLRDRIGEDVIGKIEAGTLMPNQELGDTMRQCFELQRQAIEEELRACLSKPCDEFFSCIESVSGVGAGPGREGEHGGEGFEEPSGLNREIDRKIESCVQEFQPEGFEGPPAGGENRSFEHGDSRPPDEQRTLEGFRDHIPEDILEEFRERIPEDFRPPEGVSEERFREEVQHRQQDEVRRRIEEETQKRIQEETQRRIEEEIRRQQEEHRDVPPQEPTHEEQRQEPETGILRQGFLGSVLDAVAPALKRWLPFLPL